MTARTKADLSTEALLLAGIVGAQQTPAASDTQYVENLYDDLREELIDKGLAYWPNTNRTTAEIPAVVFRALVHILTGRYIMSFGKEEPTTTDDDGKRMPVSAKGFRDLRRHMAKPASGQPTRATYY